MGKTYLYEILDFFKLNFPLSSTQKTIEDVSLVSIINAVNTDNTINVVSSLHVHMYYNMYGNVGRRQCGEQGTGDPGESYPAGEEQRRVGSQGHLRRHRLHVCTGSWAH